MFRRSDLTISGGSKDRYRAFLGQVLGMDVPTPAQEQDYPMIAMISTLNAACGYVSMPVIVNASGCYLARMSPMD